MMIVDTMSRWAYFITYGMVSTKSLVVFISG